MVCRPGASQFLPIARDGRGCPGFDLIVNRYLYDKRNQQGDDHQNKGNHHEIKYQFTLAVRKKEA